MRTIMALAIGTAALAAVLVPARAAPAWMSESELREAFAAKTIDGKYSNGLMFTETYSADGRIDYREPRMTMTGRWSLEAGSFCTIYDTSPTGGCYRVRRKGTNCFEFYFISRTEQEASDAQRRTPSWTALGWVKGERQTCNEDGVV